MNRLLTLDPDSKRARMRVGATSDDAFDLVQRAGGRKAEIYAALKDLARRYGAEIRRRYPNIPCRVSGCNLDDLLPEKGFHVARALVGSESTCALTLGATVRLIAFPPARALLVLACEDAAVPPTRLGDYLREFDKLNRRYG